MIVSAITFDLGLGTSASQASGDEVALSLSDASGLAPLTLPEAFLRGQAQQPASPSSDAVRRFEDAMSAGPKLTSYIAASMVSCDVPDEAVDSRGAAEPRRVDGAVVADRPVAERHVVERPVAERPVFARPVEERDVQRVVVEAPVVAKTVVPNNPVNPVNPVQNGPAVQEVVGRISDSCKSTVGAELRAARECGVLGDHALPLKNGDAPEVVHSVDSRGAAETRRVDGAVVVERPVEERDVQGVVVEAPVASKTVVPNNPVNPVNPVQNNSVGDNHVNVIQEVVQAVDSRGGAEPRKVDGTVVVERPAVERPVEGRDVQGMVVEAPVAPKTVVPNNPVNPVNPVQNNSVGDNHVNVIQEVVQAVDSRGAAETRKVDGTVVVERPAVERPVEGRDVQGVVVEAPVASKTVVPNNPVNPVNPVQTNVVNPLQANPAVEDVVEAVDSRGGAEPRSADGAVVAERPVVERPVVERPVVERPVAERDVQGVVAKEPATPKTVVPNNPVNPVNPVQTNPTQYGPTVEEVVESVDSRRGAEPRSADGAVAVERPAVGQPVVERPVAGRDVQGVVAKEPATPKTVVPNNPVNLVNPVKTNPAQNGPTVEEVVQPVVSRGAAESRRVEGADEEKAVAAAQHVVVAPSSVEAPAPQAMQVSPEVAAASAESARTEAIVETVNKVVEAVAGQILVTRGDVYGEGEVKITLKPTVLDGSEITMSSKDGTLSVCVTPATQEASAAAAAALPRLEIALAEHLPAFRHVAVTLAVKKGSRNEAV